MLIYHDKSSTKKHSTHSFLLPLPIMKLSPKYIVCHIKESFSMKITTKICYYPKLLRMINGKATFPFCFCLLLINCESKHVASLFSTFSPFFKEKGSKHRQLHKLALQRATEVIGWWNLAKMYVSFVLVILDAILWDESNNSIVRNQNHWLPMIFLFSKSPKHQVI